MVKVAGELFNISSVDFSGVLFQENPGYRGGDWVREREKKQVMPSNPANPYEQRLGN